MRHSSTTAVFVLAMFTLSSRPVTAQEGLELEGDVNRDGTYDLSDAVYLLSWLYLGGPPPAEKEPPVELLERLSEQGDWIEELEAMVETLQVENEELARQLAEGGGHSEGSALPSTGQAVCYDQSGNVVDCGSSSCARSDGFYASGCPVESRFVDNGDGTITDTCAGLMWQKATGDSRRANTWCGAIDYCEQLELGGHDDWRLPNIRELQSIVDYGRRAPSIDPVFSTVANIYWTSTTIRGATTAAWTVGFEDGESSGVFKTGGALVRAVRTVETP